MFKWIAGLLAWVWSLWASLPDETKAKVIRAFVDGLESFLRSYYREAKAT